VKQGVSSERYVDQLSSPCTISTLYTRISIKLANYLYETSMAVFSTIMLSTYEHGWSLYQMQRLTCSPVRL